MTIKNEKTDCKYILGRVFEAVRGVCGEGRDVASVLSHLPRVYRTPPQEVMRGHHQARQKPSKQQFQTVSFQLFPPFEAVKCHIFFAPRSSQIDIQRLPMKIHDACIGDLDVSIEDAAWYAKFVALTDGKRPSSINDPVAVPDIMDDIGNAPPTQCRRLIGDQHQRHRDSRGELWSDDRHGRWFKSTSKPIRWLQADLAHLRYGHGPQDGEVISHICGFCDCIRLGHIKYQTKSEDKLDRKHHKRCGRGSFRFGVLSR